ncbi:MAG: type II toxin-antitoxin system VapC family toxin [Acidiferrobacter sp.]
MVYLDTSVVVSLLTMEATTERVTTWFSGLLDTPAISDWTLTEFSSAIALKRKTGQLSERHAEAVRREFHYLVAGGVRLLPVSRAAFTAAAELIVSVGRGLRSGDALHLALVQEVRAISLATLDTVMAHGARSLKIPTEDFAGT